jgi:hypothetical protein
MPIWRHPSGVKLTQTKSPENGLHFAPRKNTNWKKSFNSNLFESKAPKLPWYDFIVGSLKMHMACFGFWLLKVQKSKNERVRVSRYMLFDVHLNLPLLPLGGFSHRPRPSPRRLRKNRRRLSEARRRTNGNQRTKSPPSSRQSTIHPGHCCRQLSS